MTTTSTRRGPRYAAPATRRVHQHAVIGPLKWRLGVSSERVADDWHRHAKAVNAAIVDAALQAGCPEYVREFFLPSDAARLVGNEPLPLNADLACSLAKLDADVHGALMRYLDTPTDEHRRKLARALTKDVAEDCEALRAAEAIT